MYEIKSELSSAEEYIILKAIDEHWEKLNKHIDAVFAGKKISHVSWHKATQ